MRTLFYLDACTFFRIYNRFPIQSSDSHDRPDRQKCFLGLYQRGKANIKVDLKNII